METTTPEYLPTLNGHGAPPPAAWNPAAAALPMPLPVAQVVARKEAVNEIISKVLEDGVHYGYAFGDGKTKEEGDRRSRKCLLKPGFDALCLTFQFQPDFQEMSGNIVRQDFVLISYKCSLIHIPTGRIIATGIGSCNSKEEKYRWKPGSGSRSCPDCGKATIFKAKDRPEFFCWAKKGGCGAKFADTDARILSQKTEREENDNAFNHLNTLQKMAQKRAGIAAIIPACGLSNEFTQDMEDIAENQAAAQPPREEFAEEERPAPEPTWMPLFLKDIAAAKTPADLEAIRKKLVDGGSLTPRTEAIVKGKAEQLAAATPAGEAVEKALRYLELVLRDCKTPEDYAKVRDYCKTEGGPYHDPRIVQAVNAAYKAAFPEEFNPNGSRKGEGGEQVRDRVKDIQSKTGPKTTGGEYTRYTIETLSNGFFTTFDGRLAALAAEAKAADREVEIEYLPNGRWKDLRGLKLTSPETAAPAPETAPILL